jgi:hypothetical protein
MLAMLYLALQDFAFARTAGTVFTAIRKGDALL